MADSKYRPAGLHHLDHSLGAFQPFLLEEHGIARHIPAWASTGSASQPITNFLAYIITDFADEGPLEGLFKALIFFPLVMFWLENRAPQ